MPVRHLRPVLLLAALVAGSAVGCSQRGGQAVADDPASAPAASAAPADDGPREDFARPEDTAAAVRAAGLVLLGSEQLAVHYHARLRVEVDGRRVVVPAHIGIGSDSISELHTHDESGTIHIESAEDVPFTLGQFMTEWDVALTPGCLGDRCADAGHHLTVTVDGEPYRGNPAEIVLRGGMDIQISYGPEA
jgi:hypothetical protein